MQAQQERILPDKEKELRLLHLPTHNQRPINTIKNQFRKKLARSPEM